MLPLPCGGPCCLLACPAHPGCGTAGKPETHPLDSSLSSHTFSYSSNLTVVCPSRAPTHSLRNQQHQAGKAGVGRGEPLGPATTTQVWWLRLIRHANPRLAPPSTRIGSATDPQAPFIRFTTTTCDCFLFLYLLLSACFVGGTVHTILRPSTRIEEKAQYPTFLSQPAAQNKPHLLNP